MPEPSGSSAPPSLAAARLVGTNALPPSDTEHHSGLTKPVRILTGRHVRGEWFNFTGTDAVALINRATVKRLGSAA